MYEGERNKTMKKSKILALFLALMMVLTCVPMMAFADDETSYTDIPLGSRVDVTFDADFTPLFFRINAPESGFYRVRLYQTYADSYDEYFYVGLYNNIDTSQGTLDYLDYLHWANRYTDRDDYLIFKLEAGTYYIGAWNYNSGGKKNALGIEVEQTDGWELERDMCYLGEWVPVRVYNAETGDDVVINSVDVVDPSDKSKIAIKKDTWEGDDGETYTDFYLVAKKTGKAQISVDYTAPGWSGARTATIRVNPYPAKSIKVNGKKVDIAKHGYSYTKTKYKSTKARIKVAMRTGWRITKVWGYAYYKSGNNKALKVSKTKLKKGSYFKLPKKCTDAYVGFSMKKGDEVIDYYVWFYR